MIHANDNQSSRAQIRVWLKLNPRIAAKHYRENLKRLNAKISTLTK